MIDLLVDAIVTSAVQEGVIPKDERSTDFFDIYRDRDIVDDSGRLTPEGAKYFGSRVMKRLYG